MTGKTISHYRVLEMLGSGGMGVVYKAEDTKLGRFVALKFLPEDLSKDRQALGRFQREARAASTLDHPNICTIHDIDEWEGQAFIVMELLKGDTLKHRIAGSPLPIDQMLELAIQIADALEAAHKKRILHRDIKPANIFVTELGQAKVLDFGLAKVAREPRRVGVAATASDRASTTTSDASGPGTVVGTVEYMSPEQALGRALDQRTDIFSLGTVLYEMATGRLPFSGSTTNETIDRITHAEPEAIARLNYNAPLELERLIRKCLEKDPNNRYQSATELGVDLRRLKHATDSGSARRTTTLALRPLPAARRAWTIGVAASLVGLLVGLWIGRLANQPTSPQPELKQRRLTANSRDNPVSGAAISPDGKYLAYSDQAEIHLKVIETGDTHTIAHAGRGKPPAQVSWFPAAWFPDGTKLLANAVQPGRRPSIWIISVLGGTPRELRDDASAQSVSPDGSLIAFTTGASITGDREIWLMGGHGEEPHRLVAANEGNGLDRVSWSPDGQRIANMKFHTAPDKFDVSIESRDLQGGPPTPVISDPRLKDYCWSPDGRVIYSLAEPAPNQNESNLWVVPTDTRTGAPTGKPRRITNWPGSSFASIRVSADGKRLAFLNTAVRSRIYIAEIQANGSRLKTPHALTLGDHDEPTAWTPDSKAVLFESDLNGTFKIFRQAIDQDSAEPIAEDPWEQHDPRLSPDGSWILYHIASPEAEERSGFSSTVRLMRVPTSGGAPQLVLTTRGYNDHRCARLPATVCVVGENPDQEQIVFTAFDPVQGRGRELARMQIDPSGAYNWDLSPDGSRIAVQKVGEREGRIRILPLMGQAPRDLVVKGWGGFNSIDSSADGRGLFVSSRSPSGTELLYIDPKGEAHALWEQKGALMTWGVPSPDGRYLAILAQSVDSNVWMIENF